MDYKTLSDEAWRERLTPEQYRILRQGGTEMAFTGALYHHHHDGQYQCAGCDAPLFASSQKYDSGSGWPSFFDAINPEAIETLTDRSHGMVRVEIRCARCGGHLGHVFEDGPNPTGLRYCVNSASLAFQPKNQE